MVRVGCTFAQGYLGTYDTADKVYNILFDFGSSILFWLTLIALVVSLHSSQIPPTLSLAAHRSSIASAVTYLLLLDFGTLALPQWFLIQIPVLSLLDGSCTS
jgi:hypothetical protein